MLGVKDIAETMGCSESLEVTVPAVPVLLILELSTLSRITLGALKKQFSKGVACGA